MITRTTENAVQILLYLCQKPKGQLVPHSELSQYLNSSPTYLSKVLVHLIKAGILKSNRGANGGVSLPHDPQNINLLSIVEACQGILPQAYCRTPVTKGVHLCGFHQAMLTIRQETMEAFGKWTLDQIARCPYGELASRPNPDCHMHFASQLPDLLQAKGK